MGDRRHESMVDVYRQRILIMVTPRAEPRVASCGPNFDGESPVIQWQPSGWFIDMIWTSN